jgi:hypothetical protein
MLWLEEMLVWSQSSPVASTWLLLLLFRLLGTTTLFCTLLLLLSCGVVWLIHLHCCCHASTPLLQTQSEGVGGNVCIALGLVALLVLM